MQEIDRRTFIADLSRGAFALAVVSLAACSPGASTAVRPSASASAGSTPGASGAEPPGASLPAASAGGGVPPARDELTWQRVNLGFVSAYVLVRGGQAAIVDTGVDGSADAIEDALGQVGADWSGVSDVILTHKHNDHIGSLAEVMDRASDATGYAGAEDIPHISAPRQLTTVADGDTVFGLRIVTTPGHTPGSISVHDAANGILVAGDALRVEGGKPAPPGGQFTEDMDEAQRSIAKLGTLTFETLLVGHGDPIESGASAAVVELAAQQEPASRWIVASGLVR